MDENLKQFGDLWPHRESRPEAVVRAKAYVAAHRDELSQELGEFSLDELVGMVTTARRNGHHEQRLKIDAWLIGAFPQQHITGTGGR